MLANLLDQTLELYQPTKTLDRYRAQIYVWPSTPTATYRCRLQLMSKTNDSPEKGTPRQWQVYLPGEAVAATVNDRVRISGNWYEVVSVYPVHTPAGLHHIEMVVVAFSGEVPSGD